MQIGDRILYKTQLGSVYDAIIQDMTQDGQYIEIHTDWQHIKDLNILYVFPRTSFWQRLRAALKYFTK